MKKYFFAIPVIAIFFVVILFYLDRNSQITQKKRELIHIQQIVYELQVLFAKQQTLYAEISKKKNYDEISLVNKNLADRFEYLHAKVFEFDDKKLSKIIGRIQKKLALLALVNEDLKTDTAVVVNSREWLTSIYHKYLNSDRYRGSRDAAFLEHIFDFLGQSKEIKVPPKGMFDSRLVEDYNIVGHVKIINEKTKSIDSLYKVYQENDITTDLDFIILKTLKTLNEARSETENVIKVLLISFLFLLMFIILMYAKEVYLLKETEKAKNEMQQFLDALDESAIVSKTDKNGFITYVNNMFCAISGYEREELIGKPHNIIRHPDMPSDVFRTLWETISDKKIFRAIIKNRKKNGDDYFVDTTIKPVLNVAGEISEFLAIRYDVTELVHTRDEAIGAEQAKNEFLSNMSHELRTPLNSIIGFSSILSKKTTDKEHLKYIKNISDSSENLIGLINDILDLSKLQSGKFTLEYHDFALNERLEKFLYRFDSLLENADLRIEKNFNENTKVVLNGDWLRITQVMTNLISNAIKFSPKHSKIDFSVSYDGEMLRFEVKDYGIGMSKEAQDKIFKPFEQADTSTTRKYGGTGLGLSIVVNLLEQMNGTIELESKENEGSCFKVAIPLGVSTIKCVTSEDDMFNQETEHEEFMKLEGHVLVAEDNKTNQMLISLLLDDFGLTYTIANDGVEAVEKFAQEKFDIVLMDENMPNMNGTEAMKKIYEIHGDDVPVVALTANAMHGDEEKFMELGMKGYVSKPIDETKLYEVIGRLLYKWKS